MRLNNFSSTKRRRQVSQLIPHPKSILIGGLLFTGFRVQRGQLFVYWTTVPYRATWCRWLIKRAGGKKNSGQRRYKSQLKKRIRVKRMHHRATTLTKTTTVSDYVSTKLSSTTTSQWVVRWVTVWWSFHPSPPPPSLPIKYLTSNVVFVEPPPSLK